MSHLIVIKQDSCSSQGPRDGCDFFAAQEYDFARNPAMDPEYKLHQLP
jgi:hypothetical protein